ncbi:hypothetical protein BDW74DRAFT_153814 [Aspergillus multicolor]|uniref:uncharacterized protein n=1 Tax=Aspergillus multicolor TaxID=41759 RepID=UPI003CCD7BBC
MNGRIIGLPRTPYAVRGYAVYGYPILCSVWSAVTDLFPLPTTLSSEDLVLAV